MCFAETRGTSMTPKLKGTEQDLKVGRQSSHQAAQANISGRVLETSCGDVGLLRDRLLLESSVLNQR